MYCCRNRRLDISQRSGVCQATRTLHNRCLPVMDKLCICCHKAEEHNGDPDCTGSPACDHKDCTCLAFEWDGDEGGIAVTRSTRKDSSS